MNPKNEKTMGDDVVTHQHMLAPFDQLHRSPTNPRKHFAEGPLQELAGNILKLGIQTDLHVRHSPTQPGKLEIIAGERRHRALEMAMQRIEQDPDAGVQIQRLWQVPVKLVTWDDETVIEFQLIENLQREDLTPLEEADGYAELIKRGHSVEMMAEKIGRAPNHIYRALKWARLPALARRAFEMGLMPREIATLIARIPEEKAQITATLAVVFFPDDYLLPGGPEEEWQQFEKDAWAYVNNPAEHDEVEPMKIREAREHVAEHYMRTLKGAGFDLEDADLLPAECNEAGERVCGGACSDCPFRAGASPLFSDDVASYDGGQRQRGLTGGQTGLDPNTCTKPGCLARKKQALFLRKAEEMKKKHSQVEVLAEDQSEKLFYSENLRYGSKFVDLAEKPDIDLLSGDEDKAEKVKTWEKLLKGVDVPVVVALDGKGNTRLLVERAVAITAVNEKAAEKGQESPLCAAPDRSTDSGSNETWKEQEKKRQAEQQRDKRAYVFALRAVSDAVLEKGLDGDAWWNVLEITLHSLGMDGVRLIADALEVQPQKPESGHLDSGHYAAAIVEQLKATDRSVLEVQAVLVMCQATHHCSWQGLNSEYLKKVCGQFGVSITEAKNLAKDEIKAKAKAKGNAAKPGKGKGKKAAAAEDLLSNERINADYSMQQQLEESERQRAEAPSREMGAPEAEDSGDTEAESPAEESDAQQRIPTSDDDDDELPDDPKEWPVEEQARALNAGELQMVDVIGVKPNRADVDNLKAWDAKRTRVKKAVAKLKQAA